MTALVFFLSTFPLAAQVTQDLPADSRSDTHHVLRTADSEIGYRARAGRLGLRDKKGDVRAHVFHVYYSADSSEPGKRPVTFVFNGGPGSASLWLHMGGIGPRVVELDGFGNAQGAAAGYKENPLSWLAWTDLVFVDPVGTGYSRPAKGHEQKEFSGYTEDIESVGDFIAQWTTENRRWKSAKYLAGESYGTMRSAGLSGYLLSRHNLYLEGIVLISTVLDYGTKRFAPGHDLPYALHLPTFAATAFHHGKARTQHKELRAFLDEVEGFALGDYLLALAKGDQLKGEAREAMAGHIAAYVGVSTGFVLRADLRVDLGRFTKELLRDRGRTVGRLDSRFLGFDRDSAGEKYSYDPSMSNIGGVFTSAVQDYMKRDLGYKSKLTYESLGGNVRPWSYKEFENSYVNSAETLRDAMNKNPHMRVLVLSGYFDLATPYFAADYTFSHMGLTADARNRLRVEYYESGHMMYIRRPSLLKMSRDVRRFYGESRETRK